MQYCYEQRLKARASEAGSASVDIANGRVTNVTISENQTGDKAIEGCIKGKVRRWRFNRVTESIFFHSRCPRAEFSRLSSKETRLCDCIC